MKDGIINIHGKDYMTVARRVELAHEAKALEGVETQVLNHDPVVVLAKVTIKGKVYTGVSSISLESTRAIEKQNPYEVAETSAVGRALGFAGYGVIESIASADEMIRATTPNDTADIVVSEPPHPAQAPAMAKVDTEDKKVCSAHDKPVVMYRAQSKTKKDENGDPKVYWWHKGPQGQMCFGDGYKD